MPKSIDPKVQAVRLRLFWKWLTGSTLIYISLVSAVWTLSWLVQNFFHENYEWRATNALNQDNLDKAEQVTRAQMAVEDYDFYAHRLLAEILLKADRVEEAIEVLNVSMGRERAVSGRNVYNRGLNPYATRTLLTKALRMSDKNGEALLMEIQIRKKLSLSGAGIVAERRNL